MNSVAPAPARPRWDWLLLVLTGLATIVVLAGGTEITARYLFPGSKGALQNCVITSDPSGGHGVPNSVCSEKSPETPFVDYRFNNCGHRAGMPCGPKPPGVFRIVMTGSSMAMGARVQREHSLAALLPQDLSRALGREVQLYNASLEWSYSHNTALRFKEVLAAEPDMVLWIVTPGDIEKAPEVVVVGNSDTILKGDGGLAQKAWQRVKVAVAAKSVGPALADVFGASRTSLLLRHYVYRYESPSRYLQSFCGADDLINGSLRAQFSPHWRELMQQVDSDAADMAARAHAAGVPFVATMLPSMPQAFMISAGHWPSNFDPFEVDRDVHTMVESHGGTFVDFLPDLSNVVDPAQYYFPVDQHPNDAGQALLAALLAKHLIAGAVPGLKAPGLAQTAAARGL